MPWPDLQDRLRFWLDQDRPAAAAEAERRVIAVTAEELTSIYYDGVGGNPARAIGGGNQGGQAALKSHWMLWNPADSGVDCIVERVVLSIGAAATVVAVRKTAVIGSVASQQARRDFRTTLGLAAALYSGGNAAPGTGTVVTTWVQTADVPYEFAVDCCLGPGTGLLLYVLTDNVGLQTTWWWTEIAPARGRRG